MQEFIKTGMKDCTIVWSILAVGLGIATGMPGVILCLKFYAGCIVILTLSDLGFKLAKLIENIRFFSK